MPVVRFEKAEIMHLLQKYQENDVLWNPRHPNHRNVQLKRKIWEQMADEFFTSTLEIKKKIKSLTANYHLERKKILDGEITQPTIYYYYAFENIKRRLMEKKSPNDDTSSSMLSSRSEDDLPEAELSIEGQSSRKVRSPKSPKQPFSSSKTESSSKADPSVKVKTPKKATAAPANKKIIPPENMLLTSRKPAISSKESTSNTIDRVTNKLQDIIQETTEARSKIESTDSPMATGRQPIKMIMPSKQLHTDPNDVLPSLHLKSIDHLSSKLPYQNDEPGPLESTRHSVGTSSANLGCSDSGTSLKDEDIFSCMAKVWADKLSLLQGNQRILAEKAINEIMFQAELGSLDMNLVQTISATALSSNVN